MYVCLCNAVTDRDIRKAVGDGALTLRELRQRLGVAADCGCCAREALDLLRADGVDSRYRLPVGVEAPACEAQVSRG